MKRLRSVIKRLKDLRLIRISTTIFTNKKVCKKSFLLDLIRGYFLLSFLCFSRLNTSLYITWLAIIWSRLPPTRTSKLHQLKEVIARRCSVYLVDIYKVKRWSDFLHFNILIFTLRASKMHHCNIRNWLDLFDFDVLFCTLELWKCVSQIGANWMVLCVHFCWYLLCKTFIRCFYFLMFCFYFWSFQNAWSKKNHC